MRYYDKTQRTIIRVYANSCGNLIEQQIYVIKETSQFIYANSWDGRWKYEKKSDTWFNYENNKWRIRGGYFKEMEN